MPEIPSPDNNLKVFRSVDTVSSYFNRTDLTNCESYIFARFLKPGMRILDLGVGAGRTTAYLSSLTGSYLGADYSPEMIRSSHEKFPALSFMLLDAANLAIFRDNSFDAVIFSFNGLDYLYPESSRIRCIQNCYRILADSGILIFSTHNGKALMLRPLFFVYLLISANGSIRSKVAKLLSVALNQGRMLRQDDAICAFLHGKGYFVDHDRVYGDLMTYASSSDHVKAELEALGLRSLAILGSDFPRPYITFATPWFYYVFKKQV